MSSAAAPRDPEGPTFQHGVASGDPLQDHVLIWTRISTPDAHPEVRWVVAHDEELSDPVATGITTTDASRDHTVKVDVPGLAPATTYYYGFEFDGEASPTGRTRTAPAEGVGDDHLRVAFASCAKYDDGFFNAYARIADREDLDLVVHLGDYFYEYGNDGSSPGPDMGRAMIPDHDCKTLDDYRTRYAQMRLDDDCRRMHERHPTVHVFDDHECGDDRWREGADNHDPAVDGPFEERAAQALQAWYEWLPVRVPDRDDPARIYRRLPLGGLADLIVIDCRSWRDRQATPPEMYREDRQLLGEPQHRWLCQRLRDSEATWKLVGNPIMVGQVYTHLTPDWLGRPLAELGILTEEEHGASPDQWDGYPAARSRLFAQLRQDQVRDPVFLSGDVHTAWACHLMEDPTDMIEPLAVEFVTASITTQNLNEKIGDDERTREVDVEGTVMRDNPHIQWCEFDDHGYVLLDIDPGRILAEWWFVDTVEEPSDNESMKSSWEVREGTSLLYHVAGEDTDRDPSRSE
ncbi:MAG: alkaline phosphatase D family protein [Actinobacteria bacterium]|nr:alkaline phosphatase D family protein [Actinomycetota bacterium]